MTEESRPPYPIVNQLGTRKTNAPGDGPWRGYERIAVIGDYDLLYSDIYATWDYAVTCAPSARGDGRWNLTCFEVSKEGLLRSKDEDVTLDPYHMCLLYQAIEEHRKSKGEQPKWST
jgi:hypothetical protein